jgi:hypothetical protein
MAAGRRPVPGSPLDMELARAAFDSSFEPEWRSTRLFVVVLLAVKRRPLDTSA